MNTVLFHVDAFTSEPYTGNPAGVMITSGVLTEDYMQALANELNLSETAFLSPADDGFRIRFYTPESEIDLCGHATLSSAHVIYEIGLVAKDSELKFESKAGTLKVRYNNGLIVMDFPAYKLEKQELSDELVSASGIKPIELYESNYNWYLAVLENEQDVIDAAPDFGLLKKSKYGNLIITSKSSNENIDFIVRCFVPSLGINEDPVTGSAHCALTPYWTKVLGKEELTSYQASKRGGYLRVKSNGERVMIAGNAITILKSELLV